MFGWLTPKSPLDAEDQAWIDERLEWLLRQFGWDRLRRLPMVCPTDEFFPDPYDGSQQAVRTLLPRVCRYMQVPPERIELNFYSERQPAAAMLELVELQDGTAGLYFEDDGRCQIWLETSHLDDPLSVVATLAHELGHVHLLGDRRLSPETPDHEPLTDLLTVCLGMGIFTANSVVRESHWRHSGWSGWQLGRQGYLTAPMFGYALALLAWHRNEPRPVWARHLRLDVRSAFWKSERYLAHRGAQAPVRSNQNLPPPGAFKPSALYGAAEGVDRGAEIECEQEIEPLGLDPDSADGCVARGVILVSHGEYEQAIEAFSEAIALDSLDAEAYQLRGMAQLNLGHFEAALLDAAMALELDPQENEAFRVRGLAWAGLGEHERALADFDRLVAENDEDADAHFQRGQSLECLGILDQAAHAFSRAIENQPTQAKYYAARAQTYEALGRAARAAADRRQAERRAAQ